MPTLSQQMPMFFNAVLAIETTEIVSTTFQVSAIYQQNYEIHVTTSVIS